MIADTSFIIDIMRKRKEALEKLAEIEERKERHYITAPTIFELAMGVMMCNFPEKEEKKLITILERFEILDLTFEEAWLAGVKLGELYTKGHPVDPIDAQIAGIALRTNQTIVTRNVKHFKRFKELEIESY